MKVAFWPHDFLDGSFSCARSRKNAAHASGRRSQSTFKAIKEPYQHQIQIPLSQQRKAYARDDITIFLALVVHGTQRSRPLKRAQNSRAIWMSSCTALPKSLPRARWKLKCSCL
jgi:hypothetical protein